MREAVITRQASLLPLTALKKYIVKVRAECSARGKGCSFGIFEEKDCLPESCTHCGRPLKITGEMTVKE